MAEYKISAEKVCLLIIDMTNAFIKPGAPLEIEGSRDIIPRLRKLADICRSKGIPVIHTTHIYRKGGIDIGLHTSFRPEAIAKGLLMEGTSDVEFYEQMQPEEGDIVIVKRRLSAFVGTELNLILRSNGIDTIILGGVATNMCCECTTRDARQMDYKVVFLSDGTAPLSIPDMGWGEISDEEIQKYVLATMAFGYAQVLSVEEVISRLS